jgi:hypothetical protein
VLSFTTSSSNPNSGGVRSLHLNRWRYIRYADGSEELYDHRSDPNEWTNLAANPAHHAVKARLAGLLPKKPK